MAGSSFGDIFRITTFGESHGKSVGVIIDGCPPGIPFDLEEIQHEMDRRRPGQSAVTTQRKEQDTIQVHSGVFEGKTTGTPVMLMAVNADQRSKDYGNLANLYRPSHADYAYAQKYGIRDYRGGGRSSARETLARVAAGALATRYLRDQYGIKIVSFVEQVYSVKGVFPEPERLTRDDVDATIVRCPDPVAAEKMIALIKDIRKQGDSVGGIIRCIVQGVPVGLGEPVFDKLAADLGKAMLSINAVKGFEFGSGFACVDYKGSEHNDELLPTESGGVSFTTNRAGGTLGGISSGAPIDFRVAFKPTATILREQSTVNSEGEGVTFQAQGRHDPCVLPRAVPIVDAMTALVLMDHTLKQKSQQGVR